MAEALIVLLLVAALAWFASRLFVGARSLLTSEIVNEWEHAFLVADGKVAQGPLPPGRHRVSGPNALPGPHRAIVRLPSGEQDVSTAAQSILTADRIQVKAVASLVFEVADARLALEAASPSARGLSEHLIRSALHGAVYRDANLVLRDVIGSRTLEAVLADREALDAALATAMADSFAPRGLRAVRVVVRDVILGTTLRKGYEAAEIARVEGAAALERARAEAATLRSLANAARMTRDNPALLSLRLLQTLEREGGKGMTLVLGEAGLPTGASAPPRDVGTKD